MSGALDSGQVDPLRWLPAIACATGALLLVGGRQRIALAVLGAIGATVSAWLFCALASHSWAVPVLGSADGTGGVKPPLAVLTSLPLLPGAAVSPADGLNGAVQPMPLHDALQRRFAITPIDSLTAGALRGQQRLLLAHPPLLAPSELVALDAWVRAGGRAVILADPLLVWPTQLPPGDRRRPPLTSLLDPLLGHWGLTLAAVAPEREGVERRFLASGALLPLAAAAHFTVAGGSCRTVEDGLMALCPIGRGQARLVADADLLDPRLWRGDPDDPSATSGDTMALLAGWLIAPLGPERPATRLWIRNDASLTAAMRWALVVAALWAMMGGLALHHRARSAFSLRTK